MASQLLLTGVPAFVSNVASATAIQFAIAENNFDPASLISVDLANNTSLPPTQWANVEVDISTLGGYSTVGPKFRLGTYVGALYITDRVRQKYAAALASWPPAGDELYQYQALLRSNGDVRRYHGFRASVFGPAAGNVVNLEFVPVGGAPGTSTNPRRWVDLTDALVVDPPGGGFTTITPHSPVGTIGAVFLTSTAMKGQSLKEPKLPPVLGA